MKAHTWEWAPQPRDSLQLLSGACRPSKETHINCSETVKGEHCLKKGDLGLFQWFFHSATISLCVCMCSHNSFFFFFLLFRAIHVAYGGSQVRGRIGAASCWSTPQPHQIRATSANLHHSSRQCLILNSLSQGRDQTHNLTVPSRIHSLSNRKCSLHALVTVASFVTNWTHFPSSKTRTDHDGKKTF